MQTLYVIYIDSVSNKLNFNNILHKLVKSIFISSNLIQKACRLSRVYNRYRKKAISIRHISIQKEN